VQYIEASKIEHITGLAISHHPAALIFLDRGGRLEPKEVLTNATL